MKRCGRCDTAFSGEGWTCPACAWQPRWADGLAVFVGADDDADEGYPVDVEMLDANRENFWRRARNRLFGWALDRWFPDAASFLEVGCGTGGVIRALRKTHPGLRFVGAERDRVMAVRAARALPEVEIVRADARAVPWADEFDVVGSFDVIEHIDEHEAAMAAIATAARPGGGVLISVPQHPWLWSQRDARLHHKRRYTRRLLVDTARGAGLEVVHVTSFMTLPLPLMAVQAWKNRAARDDYDPHAELKRGAWVDTPLDLALGVERAALRTGLSLPVGGSLLLVARRP